MNPLFGQFSGVRFGSLRPLRVEKSVYGLHTAVDPFNEAAGAGVSREECTNACLGEALERRGMLGFPANVRVLEGSHQQLRGSHKLTELFELKKFTDQQLEHFQNSNMTLGNVTSDRFLRWVEGLRYDGGSGESEFYPLALLSSSDPDSGSLGGVFSNGAAIHSNWLLALQAALLEAVERSSIFHHWIFEKCPIRVASSDLVRPEFSEPLNCLMAALGARLEVYDLSDYHQIPVCMAVVRGEADINEPALVVGGGAGLDWPSSLKKAVVEAGRIFLDIKEKMISGDFENPRGLQKGFCESMQSKLLHFSKSTNVHVADFLNDCNSKAWCRLPGVTAETLNGTDDLIWRLNSSATSVLVFDLTPVDLSLAGMYLAKVVLPGEIPFFVNELLRPLGCKHMSRYLDSHINPNPIPFC